MPFQFYPSLNHDRLNGQDFKPCEINNRVMLNPIYPAYQFSLNAAAICDSGAFQEIGKRLRPVEALRRQLRFRHRIRKRRAMPDWNYEALCIYDQMAGVDEAIVNGRIVKQRGTYETAKRAIAETLEAARIYHINRKHIGCPIVFIGQGIDPDQYINECILPMRQYIQSTDFIGLGGFCIIGRNTTLKPMFYETLERILPIARELGVTRVHILGVCVTDVITKATQIVKPYSEITLSSDSASPERNGAEFGKVFIDGVWRPNGLTKWIDYHPYTLAMQNIVDYVNWTRTL